MIVTLCVVGDSGTIIFSLEGGNNWYIGSYFLTEDYYSVSFSGANGIIGGSSQTIVRAEFEGTSITFFEAQSGFFGGGFWGAYMLSPDIGFVAGENSIFQPLFGKTTDSGVNWDFTAFYLNNNEGRATGIDFTDLNTGYVSARVWDGTGAIAKTTDGGNNWNSTIFNTPLWSIDFPISGASQVGYAVGDAGTILKTFDAGTSWQQQQSGISQKLNKTYFLDPEFGFAVGENGIILRTTTGGDPIPVELVSFSTNVTNNEVYLNWTTATETNNQGFEILRTNQNEIDNWNKIGFVTGYGTTTETQHYSFTDNDVGTGKYRYKLKQLDYDGSFEYSQIIEAIVDAPTKFSLEQNYPNPFNPNTKIKFSIPQDVRGERQEVTIKVYDVLGNEVATLVNEEKPAGEYEVEFSLGRDSSPDIASGIYFYTLKAGNIVETKKMILLK